MIVYADTCLPLPDLHPLAELDPYGDLPQSWTSDEPPGGGVVFCSAI